MENKKTTSPVSTLPHEIILNNRSLLKITGIIEVITATPVTILLKSSAGEIIINGESLKIQNLNNQDKTIEIQGIINEIKYNKKQKKLLEKIFK